MNRESIKCIVQSRTFLSVKMGTINNMPEQRYKLSTVQGLWRPTASLTMRHPPQSKDSLFPANTCLSEFFLHCQEHSKFSINQRFLLLEPPLISLLKHFLNKGVSEQGWNKVQEEESKSEKERKTQTAEATKCKDKKITMRRESTSK